MPLYYYALPVIAYLIGSIPFGLLLSQIFGYGDIRKIGSGNIGATNVLRTGNKGLAAATLLLDMLKGYAAVHLSFISGDIVIIFASAFFAIIGHMFPVWLKFKGGKGVATALGVILALAPPLGMVAFILWLIGAVATRTSSIAALATFMLLPLFSLIWMKDPNLAGLLVVIAGMIFWKHKENIARLRRGEEPKISFGKK